MAARRDRADRRSLSERRGSGVGAGRAEEHGRVDVRRAAAARVDGQRADASATSAVRNARARPRVTSTAHEEEQARIVAERACSRRAAGAARNAARDGDDSQMRCSALLDAARLARASLHASLAPRLAPLSAGARRGSRWARPSRALGVTSARARDRRASRTTRTRSSSPGSRAAGTCETAYLSLTRGDGGQNLHRQRARRSARRDSHRGAARGAAHRRRRASTSRARTTSASRRPPTRRTRTGRRTRSCATS